MNARKHVLWTYTHKRTSIIYKRVCKNTERLYVLAKRVYLLSYTCEVLYIYNKIPIQYLRTLGLK